MNKNVIKENTDFFKYLLIIIVAIIIAYVVYSFFIIQSNLTSLEGNLEINLQEISKKQAEIISEEIKYNIKNVNIIQELYKNDNSYNLIDEVKKFNAISNQDMIINISDMSGNLLVTTGENELSINNTKIFNYAINDDEYLSKQISESGDTYLVYSAPLKQDDEITGVILAWLDIDVLDEIVNNTIFDGLGHFSLLSSDHTVLLDKNKGFINQNIINILKNENPTLTINQLTGALTNNEFSTMPISILGQTEYLSITPLNEYNNTIYLLSFVDSSYISKDITQIGVELYIALLVTLLLFTSASLYIIFQRRQTIDKIRQTAYIDPLTGGYNSNYFQDKIKYFINSNNNYCLIFLDAKRFSSINEIYGTNFGNDLIIHIYNVLASNISNQNFFARITASKFIILKEYVDSIEIKSFVNKVNDEISVFFGKNNVKIKLNISAGVYYNANIQTLEKHLNYANLARIAIKDDYNIIINEYNQKTIDAEKEKITIENDIKEALENDYFHVYYQAKFDSRTNTIIGAEALSRIIHPTKGLISPSKFIPVAESANYISQIDKTIFKKVCSDLSLLKKQNINIFPISVNLSRLELFNSNLISFFEENVTKYNINRKYIEFEITETLDLDNYEIFNKLLKSLKHKGYKIMLDDFGSGYSSYSSILDMPIDVIKLDKSFIDGIAHSDKHYKVVKNIVDLSKILNVNVLAEGVETAQQVKLLKDIDCFYIQGYVYSKPVNLHNFLNMLKT